jgi:hypothetical protein
MKETSTNLFILFLLLRRIHLKKDEFLCKFCKEPKVFSRKDNFNSHIKLHASPDKSAQSRVGFHPEAVGMLKEMQAEMRRRKKTAGVKGSRPKDDSR